MSSKEPSYESVSFHKESTKNGFISLIGAICEAICGVDPTDCEASPSPDSALTKFDHESWGNFQSWRLTSMVLYQTTFLALLVYFIVMAYIDGRTQSFISLDKKAGVCRSEPSLNICCEVPQTITGTFLADAKGNWNTQHNFSYVHNNYAVTVSGLEYTNEQWETVMKNITDQLKDVGKKGKNRDLAWNLIAWSSFTAQNLDRGFLQFYATGLVSVIFDKPIVNAGIASSASAENECMVAMDVTYSPSTTNVELSLTLCPESSNEECTNPCPDILAPEAMINNGYSNPNPATLDLSINMQAVSTALAVNLGMIKLNNLVMIPEDNARLSLMDKMVKRGAITRMQANHTSSYFDQRHTPATPIYCHSETAPSNSTTWLSGDAFCLIRIGNTLFYPVTTAYGNSASGYDSPIMCKKEDVNVPNSAARYYCNMYDINVGLIYYPSVVNTTVSTEYPTSTPTFGPDSPTPDPTAEPTPGEHGYMYFDDYVYTYTGNVTYNSTRDDDTYFAEGDDFVPDGDANVPIDNGYIYNFGKYAAFMLRNSTGGDLFVPNRAYNTMIDALMGVPDTNSTSSRRRTSTTNKPHHSTASMYTRSSTVNSFTHNRMTTTDTDTDTSSRTKNTRGYKRDFKKLCSRSVHSSIQPNCAILAFNVYGDTDRSISNYFYQPSSTPAFSDTIYIESELKELQTNTPTSLVQTYYSCVLAPWPALFNAVGVGFSSATVFVVVGFAVYTFMLLFVMNRYFGANIPSKKSMEKAEQAESALQAQEFQRMVAVMEALKADLESGKGNLPRVAEVFRSTDADMESAKYASDLASGKRQPSSPMPTSEVVAVYRDV